MQFVADGMLDSYLSPMRASAVGIDQEVNLRADSCPSKCTFGQVVSVMAGRLLTFMGILA